MQIADAVLGWAYDTTDEWTRSVDESESESRVTQPLRPGTPGRSEFSHGISRFADPRSDYTHPAVIAIGIATGSAPDKMDVALQRQSEARSDPTNASEDLTRLMYQKGNPDMYGPDQPLVQERIQRKSGWYKQPKYRYGVARQD